MSNANHNLSSDEKLYFRSWLQSHFQKRQKTNHRYSLRAFAGALEIDASSLSQIMNGSRPISQKKVKALCAKLPAAPKDLEAIGLKRALPESERNYLQVNLDTFAAISEAHHYAILELTFVKGFDASPKWIAGQLGLKIEEVKTAIARLKRLGLLQEKNGSLIKSSRFLTNGTGVDTSAAHRHLQKQIISEGLRAVDENEPHEKDITSMTMAIDETNLEKARLLIKKFRRDLCELLEDGTQTKVYQLGIQLYPVSKGPKV